MRSQLWILVGISASLAILSACTQQTETNKLTQGSQVPADSNIYRNSDNVDVQIRSDSGKTDFNVHAKPPESLRIVEPDDQTVIEQPMPQSDQEQQIYVIERSDRDTISDDEQRNRRDEFKDPIVKVDANTRIGSVHVSAPFVKIDKDSNSRNVRIKLPGIHIDADVR